MAERQSPPDAPLAWRVDVPDEHRAVPRAVHGELRTLSMLIHDFGNALDLFDFSEEEFQTRKKAGENTGLLVGRSIPWMNIAARDACITLREFWPVMDGLTKRYAKAPWISDHFDVDRAKASMEAFNAAFPSIQPLRHAIAHRGKNEIDLDEVKKRTVGAETIVPGLKIAGDASYRDSGSFRGRTFSMTWEGTLISYDLSEDTYAKLCEICSLFYAAVAVPDP